MKLEKLRGSGAFSFLPLPMLLRLVQRGRFTFCPWKKKKGAESKYGGPVKIVKCPPSLGLIVIFFQFKKAL